MDLSVFLTQKTQTGAVSGKGAVGGQALSGNAATGIFAATGGLSFMDMIFARATAEAQTTATNKNSEQQAPKHPLLKLLSAKIAGSAELTVTSKLDYAGHNEPLSAEQLLRNLIEANPEIIDELAAELNIDLDAAENPVEAILSRLATLEVTENGIALEDGTIIVSPDKLEKALPAVTAEAETAISDETPEDVETTFKRIVEVRRKVAALLSEMIKAVPQGYKPVIIEVDPAKLKNILGKLQAENNAEGASALIATGLTPEDITKLMEQIGDGDEQGEAFVIGFVKILPPEAKKDAVFLPRGVVIAGPQHQAGDISTPQAANDTAAKLNALTVGEGEEASLFEESDFEGVLRVLERAQTKGQKNGMTGENGIAKAIENIRQQVSAGLSTVPGTSPALTEVFTDFAMNNVFPEGWDFATGSSHSLNLTGPAQLTSMVSHIQQAGLPHPATQMVASAIAKATTNGESKNITIQLDPPDLGKVSVRMEFGKDNKSMKTLMVAEKPETFLMLQRDAHILERALQDAGIDMDGGISFELSQDGNMFEDDRHSTGGNSGGGSDAANEDNEDEIVIETRMDWYVDPETGLTRYDALV